MSSGRIAMRRVSGHRSQRGATLIVALIMLVLITLVMVSGFSLSTSNLKSVGNMQAREESVAAANRALEVVIGSTFATAPLAQEIEVDINSDGVNDYTVVVDQPDCVKVTLASSGAKSGVGLNMGSSAGTTWFTDWDLKASVTDASSGAQVSVRQGVRVLLSDAQMTAVCT